MKFQACIVLAIAVAFVVKILTMPKSERIQRAEAEEDYLEHERWLKEVSVQEVCTSDEAAAWLEEMRDGRE